MAGVVALIWSANSALIGQIEATERILIETAQPLPVIPSGAELCGGADLPNNLEGFGLIDAYAAVERALQQK